MLKDSERLNNERRLPSTGRETYRESGERGRDSENWEKGGKTMVRDNDKERERGRWRRGAVLTGQNCIFFYE